MAGKHYKRCPVCGRKMKHQATDFQHCRCGISFFRRTPDMVFGLERKKIGQKIKQVGVIKWKNEEGGKAVKQKIISNIIRCNQCGDIIKSISKHDFVKCSCGNCAIDGGNDYLRRYLLNSPDDFTELSVVEEIN